jgi:hypothetical protein
MSTRTTAHEGALAGKEGPKVAPAYPVPDPLPYLLDFYPLEDAVYTQISPFFEGLKAGKFLTSYCPSCDRLHWPPRIACDQCTAEKLEWKMMSKHGKVFAFTQMLLGAPMGMEKDLPFVIAVVEVEGTPFKILSRVDEAKYEGMRIGMPLELKVIKLNDGRVFYRYRPGPAVPD